MTSEHDSVSGSATSFRETGEVCCVATCSNHDVEITDAWLMSPGMVDESMSGKEGACERRRSRWLDHSQECQREVRAAIVAKKQGIACEAKGGRKANGIRP